MTDAALFEFGARLLKVPAAHRDAVDWTDDRYPWLTFGEIVAAMRERGWRPTLKDDVEDPLHLYGVSFTRGHPGMRFTTHTAYDENPALAALKAARAALGDEA